jgi:hypothetical protein
MKRSKYLVPLTNSVSLTILEQPLVVRNAVIAVDEAGAEVLLAIVFWLRNDAIPGSAKACNHTSTKSRSARRG